MSRSGTQHRVPPALWRCLPILLFVCHPPVPVWADNLGVGAIFLEQPVGARAAGMGEAFVGVSDDPSGGHWNPAGLVLAPTLAFQFTHTAAWQDQREEFLSLNLPFSSHDAFGISGYYGFLGNFEKLTDFSGSGSTFSAYNLYLNLAWSHAWSPIWSTGLAGKAIFQSIDTYTGWGFAGDVGLMAENVWPELRLGLTLKNLGPPIRLLSQADPLPISVAVGAGYRLWNGLCLLALDMNKPLQPGLQVRAGLELAIARSLFIRTGYQYASEASELGGWTGLTAGVGLDISDYKLDYAFTPYGDLGSTHRLSMTFPFGRSAAEQNRLQKQYALQLKADQQKVLEAYLRKGNQEMSAKNYLSALNSYERIAALDPSYPSISAKIENVQTLIRQKNADKHYHLGLQAQQKRDDITALIEWNKALELMPNFPGLKGKLAQVNAKLTPAKPSGRVKKRKPKPSDDRSELFDQGLAYLQKGQYQQAKTSWQELLRLDPDNAQVRAYLSQARNLSEMESDDWLQQAEEFWSKKSYLEAVSLWRKVLRTTPENTAAAEALAKNQEKINQLAEEHYLRGVQHYAQGALSQALMDFKTVLLLQPEHAKAQKSIEKIREKVTELKGI